MSSIPPTAPRARDLAVARKRSLRAGMGVLRITVPQLADMLGVEDDTAETVLVGVEIVGGAALPDGLGVSRATTNAEVSDAAP